jgi:hypothetical protein
MGASFSNRTRALQPKRRQRHGAFRCNERARHATASPAGFWLAWSRIVRRGPAFQAAQGLFSPSADSGMVPFAAMSVQGALSRHPQVFGKRGVASCDVGQLFKPPKGSSDQAPATSWRPSPQ